MCYCSDCQALLKHIGRTDLLDKNGGSEIIPAYPADIKLLAGREHLACLRLSDSGMFRFYATCCRTPIANTDPVRAWVGIHRRMYTAKDPDRLDRELGPVRARIMGKDAQGTPPKGTPQKFNFKGFVTVMPFILKGIIFGKAKPSAFFENGTSIVVPTVLTAAERSKLI